MSSKFRAFTGEEVREFLEQFFESQTSLPRLTGAEVETMNADEFLSCAKALAAGAANSLAELMELKPSNFSNAGTFSLALEHGEILATTKRELAETYLKVADALRLQEDGKSDSPKANLGLATTREMLQEIAVRGEVPETDWTDDQKNGAADLSVAAREALDHTPRPVLDYRVVDSGAAPAVPVELTFGEMAESVRTQVDLMATEADPEVWGKYVGTLSEVQIALSNALRNLPEEIKAQRVDGR